MGRWPTDTARSRRRSLWKHRCGGPPMCLFAPTAPGLPPSIYVPGSSPPPVRIVPTDRPGRHQQTADNERGTAPRWAWAALDGGDFLPSSAVDGPPPATRQPAAAGRVVAGRGSSNRTRFCPGACFRTDAQQARFCSIVVRVLGSGSRVRDKVLRG